MSRRLLHRAITIVGIVAVAGTLSAAPASAGGPPAKISSFSVTPSNCDFDAVVAWNKVAVAEIQWTLSMGKVQVIGDFTQSTGTLTSPVSIVLTGLNPATTSATFTVTADLFTVPGSATPVASATSKKLKADCG
jgi:hypothetical protein